MVTKIQNAFFLWNSSSVLWTEKLHPTIIIRVSTNELIFILGGTTPLRHFRGIFASKIWVWGIFYEKFTHTHTHKHTNTHTHTHSLSVEEITGSACSGRVQPSVLMVLHTVLSHYVSDGCRILNIFIMGATTIETTEQTILATHHDKFMNKTCHVWYVQADTSLISVLIFGLGSQQNYEE